MATRRTARPLGTLVVASLHRGTLDGCDPPWPGSVGYPGSGERAGYSRCADHAPGAWIPFDLSALPTGESPPARGRGALRIVRGRGAHDAHFSCLKFSSIDAAMAVASRLVEHPAAQSELREASVRMGAAQVGWIARQLLAGEMKILWRLRAPAIRPQAAAPERAPPPPRAVARPASAPTPVDSTFPPNLDAPAVAQSLKNAAADGVPFCEECTKAAQQQNAAAETA